MADTLVSAETFATFDALMKFYADLSGGDFHTTGQSMLDVIAAYAGGRIFRNQSAASQSITAATLTQVTGTLVTTPAGALKVGSRIVFVVWTTKALVGTTGAVWHVKIGTAGTTADVSVLQTIAITGTAVADEAMWIIEAVITAIGAATSATAAGSVQLAHRLPTTGWATAGANVIQTIGANPPTAAGFNSTAATKISLAVNSPFAMAITQASIEVLIG